MADKQTIALADDDAQVLALYERFLLAGNYQTQVATTAEDLIAVCLAKPVNLIVTDLQLPGMSGIDALVSLRQLDLPAIVVTGDAELADVAELVDSGAFSLLIKPVGQDELLAAVAIAMKRWLEQRTLKCEVESARNELEQRKLIERAKGQLMRTGNVDEATAYRILQKSARRRRVKLVQIAEEVINSNSGQILHRN